MIAKKEAENSRGAPVDLKLSNLKIEISGYKMDAQASVEKGGIKMWGYYNGIDFKMTLRPNGYVWFELGHKRFNHPISSSSAAQFKEFVEGTRADQVEVKKMFLEIWSKYNAGIIEKTMVNEKVSYNTIGHFNFYLDSTMNFAESLTGSRVMIEGNAGRHPTIEKIRSSFSARGIL